MSDRARKCSRRAARAQVQDANASAGSHVASLRDADFHSTGPARRRLAHPHGNAPRPSSKTRRTFRVRPMVGNLDRFRLGSWTVFTEGVGVDKGALSPAPGCRNERSCKAHCSRSQAHRHVERQIRQLPLALEVLGIKNVALRAFRAVLVEKHIEGLVRPVR